MHELSGYFKEWVTDDEVAAFDDSDLWSASIDLRESGLVYVRETRRQPLHLLGGA